MVNYPYIICYPLLGGALNMKDILATDILAYHGLVLDSSARTFGPWVFRSWTFKPNFNIEIFEMEC